VKDILVVMTKRVSLLPEKDFRVDFCVFNCSGVICGGKHDERRVLELPFQN
jgi:hypothetical protein